MTLSKIKQLAIIASILDIGTMLYWVYFVSIGLVPSLSTLLLMYLIITIINFYIVDNIKKREISELKTPINFINRVLTVYIIFLTVTGKLVYWWILMLFMFMLATYILVRRPDLVDIY
jgi:hypothetical protein